MNTAFAIQIKSNRWHIKLSGDFSQETASSFVEQVQQKLSDSGCPLQVFMDLRALDGFSVFARTFLVQAQEKWRQCGARTAYLSDRPRFRGLGLWVCHLAEDDCAGSFINEADVEAWLASNKRREDDARSSLAGAER